MVPLSAEILTERESRDGRRALRRSLRLGVQAHSAGEVAMALILNMSEKGLLIETVIKLEIGETLRVDIPDAGAAAARVVWTDGFLAGCKFINPVSTAAVSALRLRAPGMPNAQSPTPEDDDRTSAGDSDRDEAQSQWAILMITALMSVVALIVFLAAILVL